MKMYYYVKDSHRLGPFTFDQLKTEGITLNSLVWFEGLSSWQFAKDLDEMDEIFNPAPMESEAFIPDIPTEIKVEEAVVDLGVKDQIPKESNDIVESTYDDSFIARKRQGMFSNPFGVSGRIRRTEYWLSHIVFYVYYFLVIVLLGGFGSGTDEMMVFVVLLIIPGYWFLIAQGAKRCHDRGNSGWFQLIPFYGLWMAFAEGDNYDNGYGPNPKN